MKQDQIKREIAIIKDMIEKTRKETAESGLLFIIPGILYRSYRYCLSALDSILPVLYIKYESFNTAHCYGGWGHRSWHLWKDLIDL